MNDFDKTREAKMSNELPKRERLPSAAAERMRRHRERRRQGLRYPIIEFHETEIDALVRRGLWPGGRKNLQTIP